MIPIPANIPPWLLRIGASGLILFAAFTWGCQHGKGLSAGKIERLKETNRRYVEIIEVFQENYDVLDLAIKDQNESIAKLGEETERRVTSLKASHEKSLTILRKRNAESLRKAEKDSEELRKRLVGLSVGEACVESLKVIASNE